MEPDRSLYLDSHFCFGAHADGSKSGIAPPNLGIEIALEFWGVDRNHDYIVKPVCDSISTDSVKRQEWFIEAFGLLRDCTSDQWFPLAVQFSTCFFTGVAIPRFRNRKRGLRPSACE